MSDPTLEYCQAHTSPVRAVLAELERATHLRTLSPQMLSGAYQGMLLRLLSIMIQPRRVLEIGTFTGYSTICLADGLLPDGLLYTIEANDELGGLIREYLQKAGVAEKVHLYLGDAAVIIPIIAETFDLVFMDAGKLDYARHYALALDRLRPGGFLLADNVLWDGKVAQDDVQDATAQVLRDFNLMVQQDVRVENILLPVRDGIMVVRKVE